MLLGAANLYWPCFLLVSYCKSHTPDFRDSPMCTLGRWIYNKYIHKRLFVKCGKCAACQQEKALTRTNKIRANVHLDGSFTCLFVTLTYETKYIPYIRMSDFSNSNRYLNFSCPSYRPKYNYLINSTFPSDINIINNKAVRVDDVEQPIVYNVPIRRDFKPLYFRNASECGLVDKEDGVLDNVFVGEFDKPLFLRFLNGQTSDRVGVIYYKDIQNFHKRLKQILSRNYGVSNYYEYFSCSEYGPTTQRPHFHLLIWCPVSLWQTFKAAIVKAWPYADNCRTFRNIEIARDASSYVSSYVNCGSSIPPLFKAYKAFKPKHSHSLHFGQNLEFMAFDKICSSILRGDMHTTIARVRNGTLVNDVVLLPKYVLNRYFPKFKGHFRLAPDTLRLVYERPSELLYLYKELGMDMSDCQSVITRLNHTLDYALSQGLSSADYSFIASRCWYLYQQSILSDFYSDVEFNNYFAYDNIKDLFDGKVLSPSLSDYYEVYPPNLLVLDPNTFPQRVASSLRLIDAYNSYSKDRKIRNSILNQYDYTF